MPSSSPIPSPPPPPARSRLGRSSVLADPHAAPAAKPASGFRKARSPSPAPLHDPVAALADEVDQEDYDDEDREQGEGDFEGEEVKSEEDESEFAMEQAQAVEEQNAVISRSMSDLTTKGGGSSLVRSTEPQRSNWGSTVARFVSALLGVALFTTLVAWKNESASIGYCNANSDTNPFLDGIRQRRSQIQECNAKLISRGPDEVDTRLVDGLVCSLEPLNPIPPPDSCTPCPKRATCTHHIVQCDGAFIPKRHPANSLFPFKLDVLFDGLPGFGSVAFPPTCVEDRRRLAHLVTVEKQLEKWLARVKGDKICKGVLEEGGGDAKAWGIQYDELWKLSKPGLTVRTHFLDVGGFGSDFDPYSIRNMLAAPSKRRSFVKPWSICRSTVWSFPILITRTFLQSPRISVLRD